MASTRLTYRHLLLALVLPLFGCPGRAAQPGGETTPDGGVPITDAGKPSDVRPDGAGGWGGGWDGGPGGGPGAGGWGTGGWGTGGGLPPTGSGGGAGSGGGSGGASDPCSGTPRYHVSTTGLDSQAGSSQAPFRSIQHALDVATDGDIILVHGGIYRERSLKITHGGSATAALVLCGATNETQPVVVDHGLQVASWVPDVSDAGSGVYRGSPSFGLAAEKDATVAVVVDGQPLAPASSRAAMTAGTFAVDAASGTVYVWTAGGQAPGDVVLVNTGTSSTGLTVANPSGPPPSNVVLEGITFRGGEIGVHAIAEKTSAGTQLTLLRVKVQSTWAEGLRLDYYNNVEVLASELRHTSLLNWPRMAGSTGQPAIGGHASSGVDIVDSTVRDSHGPGVLAAEASNGWLVQHSDIHDSWKVNLHWASWGSGLFVQNSAIYNTSTYDDLLEGNRAEGIRITNDNYEQSPATTSVSAGLNFYNNVIFNTRGALLLFPDTPSGTATVTGMTIEQNTFAAHVGTGPAVLLRRSGGVYMANNIAYPGRIELQAITVSTVTSYCNLVADFASYLVSGGYVNTGLLVTGDPRFVGGTGPTAFRVSSGSPAIDACTGGEDIDYLGGQRPQGANFDIGAFER